MDQIVITIDGPAGVGKSTLARQLSGRLGIAYLDTGAMFRTLALRLGADAGHLGDDELRARVAALTFSLTGSGAETRLCCNGVPVGDEIRTEEVGLAASKIAQLPVIRTILCDVQQSIGKSFSLVAEGRDMGTVVFPHASCKFFLDARPEVRAERRRKDLEARGQHVDINELVKQIRERDDLDRNRPIAPLRPAEDAVLVDTSDLDIDGVLAVLYAHAGKAAGR